VEGTVEMATDVARISFKSGRMKCSFGKIRENLVHDPENQNIAEKLIQRAADSHR